jgi:hypothetical protein
VTIAAAAGRALILRSANRNLMPEHRRTSAIRPSSRMERISGPVMPETPAYVPPPRLPRSLRIRYLSVQACSRYAAVERSGRTESRCRLSRIA